MRPINRGDSNTPRFRSVSMTLRSNTMDASEQNNSEGSTGPLRGRGQASAPLYSGHNHEVSIEPHSVALEQHALEATLETGASSRVWPVDTNEVRSDNLIRSGQLGMCNDPYCTLCPTVYHDRPSLHRSSALNIFAANYHNLLQGDGGGCARRMCLFMRSCIPGVMNPHAKIIQRWNKFLVVSCLFAIFVDPLFFFLLLTNQVNKCIVLDWPLTKALVIWRTLNDFIYFLNILLQFRLAYVAPESKVVGAGALVDDPKKIAQKYLSGYFILDFFVVLPLPQIIILLILPRSIGDTGANYAKNLLRTAILAQYIPRLYRFFPLLAGQSSTGFIFESAWSNFIINLLMFVLAGHVIGSCWYLFAVQRVNQCLRDACHTSGIANCMQFIDCGHGGVPGFKKDATWGSWVNNSNASACFVPVGGTFAYGIYQNGILLTTQRSVVTRYIYSLFWGFQQISTLAGNQAPSSFVWEVLFTMLIIGIGLLLFALLIGNMQNFLQSLGRRRLEMSLRHRDVEQWMRHRRLPEDLRRQVRDAERFYWAATRGVDEEGLMENLPEDLQRDIRRHLFKYMKRVRIFQLLDDVIIDAICERLRTRTFIKGGKIFFQGGIIDKMVFIIRGQMESIGEDQIVVPLTEGDVCGEELLTWCLENSSLRGDWKRPRILLSNRSLRCLTNVEAFVLRCPDLEEITSLFSRFLSSSRVQSAIRYQSPYYRSQAAIRIQVAWRYWRKRLNRRM